MSVKNCNASERTLITKVQDFASEYGGGFTQAVSDKASGVVSLVTDSVGTISNAITSESNAIASLYSVVILPPCSCHA